MIIKLDGYNNYFFSNDNIIKIDRAQGIFNIDIIIPSIIYIGSFILNHDNKYTLNNNNKIILDTNMDVFFLNNYIYNIDKNYFDFILLIENPYRKDIIINISYFI